MDRRYTCWLTEKGVCKIKAERDKILNEKLPALRKEAGKNTVVLRKNLLKRVLFLNQWLNYNGNPETRHSHLNNVENNQNKITEENFAINEQEMAEYIQSELIKQGVVVKIEDLLKVFELEMEYYTLKGIAEPI